MGELLIVALLGSLSLLVYPELFCFLCCPSKAFCFLLFFSFSQQGLNTVWGYKHSYSIHFYLPEVWVKLTTTTQNSSWNRDSRPVVPSCPESHLFRAQTDMDNDNSQVLSKRNRTSTEIIICKSPSDRLRWFKFNLENTTIKHNMIIWWPSWLLSSTFSSFSIFPVFVHIVQHLQQI